MEPVSPLSPVPDIADLAPRLLSNYLNPNPRHPSPQGLVYEGFWAQGLKQQGSATSRPLLEVLACSGKCVRKTTALSGSFGASTDVSSPYI